MLKKWQVIKLGKWFGWFWLLVLETRSGREEKVWVVVVDQRVKGRKEAFKGGGEGESSKQTKSGLLAGNQAGGRGS